MDAYTQERRLLQIDTVLGQDHLLLVSLRGKDTMSSCFSYDLELASTDATIEPGDLLGTAATIWLNDGAGQRIPINGIISRFGAARNSGRGLSFYRIRLVPSLWLLTRTSDCRIFQDLNVSQIIDKLLAEYGITNKAWRLNGQHPVRDYCVQYRESAFDFICRLLEEEAIFFYFRHDEHSHTVVFSDNNRGLAECPNPQIVLTPDVGAPGGIWSWEDAYKFRSSRWALADYNFEMPSTRLVSHTKTINPVLASRPFEMFDYPGRYPTQAPGDALAKLRIEYEEAAYQDINGEGSCVGFGAGAYFKIADASKADAETEYLITSIEHSADDRSFVTTNAEPPSYTNRFHCVLRSVPYKPQMKTAKPSIPGTQTAVVTGPAGTEIFTDKYGRIKVQFHWDRQGKMDANSSCFIRVAQSWAGRNFGTIFLPRIGQEVVVTFEEGDPDRPLIVGSVYNAEQMVPFNLPANKTQSGLRTRSSMGGTAANCNEFVFEDLKGSEFVRLHAERNLMTEVEHDASHWVGHDEQTTVDNNRTETVHGNETLTIDKNRTETVHANETITIDKNRTETVQADETVTIDLNRSHTVGLTDTLTVGAARTHTVGGAEAITVGAVRTVTVGASQTISVGGSEATSIGKDRSTTIGRNETLEVGKTLTISAGDEIVLKTGDASITMKKNGDITIQGKKITIKGSGNVVIKGQKILQN